VKRAVGSWWVGVVAATTAIAASCTSGAPTPRPPPTTERLSSPFRAAIEDFGFTGGFDPTGELSRLGMAVLSQLLVRTLVTYTHVAGPSGLVPVADLATDTGHVSADGLVWTFTLKNGVRFGPPLRRVVTSADVEFAFRRIDGARFHAQYGTLYDGLISGMDGPVDSMPKDISGIETPDRRTVVFDLTRPAGDFLHRLAMPASAPLPFEIAGCFTRAGDYGRDVVSTGPYMIRGAAALDASSCGTVQPMAGFEPTRWLRLDRNPNYDPSTDDPDVRSNRSSAFDIEIDTNSDDIVRRIERGELDATLGVYRPAPVRSSDRGITVHLEPLNALSYISMNVLVPPFDDIHVRRAVSLALNRKAIVRAEGGPSVGGVADHLFPPSLVESGPPVYRRGGALEQAGREMALSHYDSNRDGLCDASACERVIVGNPPSTPPDVNAYPVVLKDLQAIGINLEIREFGGTVSGESLAAIVTRRMPLTFVRMWTASYPDPSAIAASLHSSGIVCLGQTNYAEISMTEAQAKVCGVLRQYRGSVDAVPSLDARIDACEPLVGGPRSACWADLDTYAMREVVPWAPIRIPNALILAGRTVTHFEFDQAFGVISLCHIGASPGASR
jgi:peptide/nickel transport system substrate-binding protein